MSKKGQKSPNIVQSAMQKYNRETPKAGKGDKKAKKSKQTIATGLTEGRKKNAKAPGKRYRFLLSDPMIFSTDFLDFFDPPNRG